MIDLEVGEKEAIDLLFVRFVMVACCVSTGVNVVGLFDDLVSMFCAVRKSPGSAKFLDRA